MSKQKRYRGEVRRLRPGPSLGRTLFWLGLAAPMALVAGWYGKVFNAVAWAFWSDLQRAHFAVTWDHEALVVITAMAVLSMGAASSAYVAAAMRREVVRNVRRLTER